MSSPRLIPAAQLRPDDLKALRVVVVDDNVGTLRLVSDVLRASGVGTVHTAGNGREALDGLRRWDPDMLFVDWNMPVMDGLQLTRTIRAAALGRQSMVPNPKAPIIMLTGQKREKDVEQARQAGVNEFIAKPFTPAALISRIQMVLTQPRHFVIANRYVGPDRRRRLELNYTGPLRRMGDPDAVADAVERDLTRQTIGVELDALRRLVIARGGVDKATLQMTYRAMQHNVHRARAVRDTMIEQASNSMIRYVEAMGGIGAADPEVVDIHMDAMRTLLSLGDSDAQSARLVVGQLDKVVTKKIAAKADADTRACARAA